MNFLDIILGILIAIGLYKGLKNGLFVELASLVALIAGIYGSIHFSYIASDYLIQKINWDLHYIKIVSFLITFVTIILLVQYSGKLLTKIADFTMLGFLNIIAGGIFGALKVAIILGALLVFFEKAVSTLSFINIETQKESILYEPIRDIGNFIFNRVFKEEKS